MAQGKRMEIGDEIPVWDIKEKIDEFYDRVEKAREELKEKQRIVYYVDKKYKYHYKLKPQFLYKQTITSFRPLDLGGAPRYKDHYLSFTVITTNDGRKMARKVTSNPEEVAFLDMKEGIVREENRELTPMEKASYEKRLLEDKVAKLEAQLKPEEKVEPIKAEEDIKENNIKEETKEKKVGRPPKPKG